MWVCQKKMDWSCGGYYCKRCHNSVYHTKCATRKDVSDCEEMKDEPEEAEDIEPFVVIDENTIELIFHKKHNLRLDKSGIFVDERICSGCIYPINHQSFYTCLSCTFILHERCANLLTGKRHMVCSMKYYLHKAIVEYYNRSRCGVYYNGFTYISDKNELDVRCASVTEPFIHQSHPHPLFYTTPTGVCSVCNKEAHHVLRCVEDGCEYVMDFKCALLPYLVKHRVDNHFLSLNYGKKDASGKYWCDICEKETDSKTWFYTCENCGVNLHINCMLGDFGALEPGSKVYKRPGKFCLVVRNNSMSRPMCMKCKFRCIFPIIMKRQTESSMSDEYLCSENCYKLDFYTIEEYEY